MIQSGKQSDRSIYKWVIRMQPTYTINNKMSYILGISAYYHDAAAALIKDGEIIAAAQEERFTRIKNDASFPANAIRYCLQQAGILLCDISTIIYYEKPYLKFERILEIFYRYAPWGMEQFIKGIPIWIEEKLFCKRMLKRELRKLGNFCSRNIICHMRLPHFSVQIFKKLRL